MSGTLVIGCSRDYAVPVYEILPEPKMALPRLGSVILTETLAGFGLGAIAENRYVSCGIIPWAPRKRRQEAEMHKPIDSKEAILREQGLLNSNAAGVTDDMFQQSEFSEFMPIRVGFAER